MFTVAAGAIGLFLLNLTAVRPSNLGVHEGRLSPCPSSPNCVSTQASDQEHWIAPLSVSAESPSPIETLADIVRTLPRATIVEQSNNYLRAEFRSRIFRFCDDVEFYFEAESNRVHFRSASRVGHSDLGVNRERMELIRKLFQQETASSVNVDNPFGMHAKPRSSNNVFAGMR
jgi:uncharacterized protein (DUF1499 family)